jgi:molecular chaperone HscC
VHRQFGKGRSLLVGIDLGTTNSAVAVWKEDGAQLIPNALGDLLTPSAVSFGEDDQLLIGMAARERQVTHPHLSATAFKRLMGTAEKVKLGKRTFTPEELSSFVLAALKADAEAHLGEPVTGAIITVPAYFNDKQRRATRTAGELAGLKVERLINEPTAAALAHGIHQLDDEEPFLIFDLGGGTFDVSLVEMFDGIIEVRASAGDNRLGGEDFNAAMANLASKRIDPWASIKGAQKAEFKEIVRAAAERSRRALTDGDVADFSILWDGQQYETQISSAQFEEEVSPLLDRLREPVKRSLRDSGINPDQLGKIILVGGSTRMPIVRRAVTRMFGRFPDTTLDPDYSVALGAAVQAGLQSRDAALDEVRLTDVCPFSLGIETAEYGAKGRIESGLFTPLIERNTVIPASRVHTFSPMEDGQREVVVRVYQGEARRVESNVFLESIKVPLPAGKRHEVSFDVRFSYDVSGLLEVDIEVPKSGAKHQLLIRDSDNGMSDKELEKRREELAKLKVHPRDDAANAAVLARAERCYEGLIAESRNWLGAQITQFVTVLDGQDGREIAEARAQLEELLEQIDGERIL